jgi:hypothetical protein
MKSSLLILLLDMVLICEIIGSNSYTIYAQKANSQSNNTNFFIKGTISHALDFPMSGPFELIVWNGKVTGLTTNITHGNNASRRIHDHKFSNFQQAPGTRAELNMNNTGGTVDVGYNKN